MAEELEAASRDGAREGSELSLRAGGRFWLEEHRIRSDRDVIVPLVDEQEAGCIYDPSLHRWACWGAFSGAVPLGSLGWAAASGALPMEGFGQWAASGAAVAAFTGGGLGVAIGGLAGALLALYRMPRRNRTPR